LSTFLFEIRARFFVFIVIYIAIFKLCNHFQVTHYYAENSEARVGYIIGALLSNIYLPTNNTVCKDFYLLV